MNLKCCIMLWRNALLILRNTTQGVPKGILECNCPLNRSYSTNSHPKKSGVRCESTWTVVSNKTHSSRCISWKAEFWWRRLSLWLIYGSHFASLPPLWLGRYQIFDTASPKAKLKLMKSRQKHAVLVFYAAYIIAILLSSDYHTNLWENFVGNNCFTLSQSNRTSL